MRIFLVRHGQSQSNVDKRQHQKIADHAMPLSKAGHQQAKEAGAFLCKYFRDNHLLILNGVDEPIYLAARLWVSPYLRTRETADNMEGAFRKDFKKHDTLKWGRREHINLCEQQFGLFDGYEDEDLEREFPREYEHYKKCEDQEGKFWARMPLGESRFDVAVRCHQAFGTFKRDEEKHGIDNIIVVAHGATLRAFTMQWLHFPYEWFEKEPNPKNCSIRLIEDDADRGYIFEGFPSPRSS